MKYKNCCRCGGSMRGRPFKKFICCKKCDKLLEEIYGDK